MKRLLLVLALFAATVPATASAQTGRPIAAAIAKAHVAGDPLFVEWGGSWWKATVIVPLPDGRVVIHYDGWSQDYDEIATPKRIRTALPTAATPSVGDSVFVEWKGSFWPAKVLNVSTAGVRVHYDGFGPEWDEDVPVTRLLRLSPPEG